MRNTILAATVLLMIFSGCKKEVTLRQTQYTLIPQNNSGLSGYVTFSEQAATSQTLVDIEVSNTYRSNYLAHIHQGAPGHYRAEVYIFDSIPAHGGRVSYQQIIPLQYDSALKFDGTFVFHDITGDTVLAYAGIGINK